MGKIGSVWPVSFLKIIMLFFYSKAYLFSFFHVYNYLALSNLICREGNLLPVINLNNVLVIKTCLWFSPTYYIIFVSELLSYYHLKKSNPRICHFLFIYLFFFFFFLAISVSIKTNVDVLRTLLKNIFY